MTTQTSHSDSKALAAALVTVAFWASAFVGIRSAGRSLSPGPLSLFRLAVALVVLTVVSIARHERMPSRADLRAVRLPLVFCGVVWFGAYNLMLNAGERHVDAGTAAMLVNVGPILIAVFAGLFLREGFPRNLFVGCAVAFAGVGVIALATATHKATMDGIVLCIASAFAYAAGAVTQKVVLRRLSALQTIFACCVIGVVCFIPFAPQLIREAGAAPAGALSWAVYLGAFPTALGFVMWAYALRRTDAGRMGALTYLVPPLSVALGWLLLGEAPAGLAFVGGAMCLVGVAVSRARRRGSIVHPVPVPAQTEASEVPL